MGPYYRSSTLASSSTLTLEASLLESMEKANEEELKKLDERLAEAEKIEGESEISDALKARANYLTRIGDKVCLLTPRDCYIQPLSRNGPSLPKSLRWRRPPDSDRGSTLCSPSLGSAFSSTIPPL